MLDAREERMKLERRNTGCPRQGANLADHDVMDLRFATSAPNRVSLHPIGRKAGSILLPEKFPAGLIGIALQTDAAVVKMWQEKRRDANVVIDDLRLGKSDERENQALPAWNVYSSGLLPVRRSTANYGLQVASNRRDVYPPPVMPVISSSANNQSSSARPSCRPRAS